MIVVADASPVCYLVLIGEVDVLPRLFTRIFLPEAVLGELKAGGAPPGVQNWAAQLPSWVSVKAVGASSVVGLERLQAGECEVILLAQDLKADLVLLDEKSARKVALARGLRVTGLLGVLAEAATHGFVDLPDAVGRLKRTSFRYSPALLKAFLNRFALRKIE